MVVSPATGALVLVALFCIAGCSATTPTSDSEDVRTIAAKLRADESRARSLAAGNEGGRLLEDGQPREALVRFRTAIASLGALDAPDLEYVWQWRSARALRQTGDEPRAASAYARAVDVLARLRTRRRGSCEDLETRSLRSAATELHREYIDLLLRSPPNKDEEATLRTARAVAEAIKLDEVRDYFADECISAAGRQSVAIDTVEPDAAVIYPVVLADRLEILVATSGLLHRVRVPISATELSNDCAHLRQLLELRTTRQYLPSARRLYDLVIRPIEPFLEKGRVSTLIYVPSGPLMAVPLGAFHDGAQFVASRYAVAVAPTLDLVDPRPFQVAHARALVCGETNRGGDYAELPSVTEEVALVGGRTWSRVLLDDAFTLERIQGEFDRRNFDILHLAAHATLGERGRDSFIVAHGETISMDQLGAVVSTLRRRNAPLELLTLSACETAGETERSAFGLAGLAIKAGAKSAVASLWSVDDAATARLMDRFYGALLSREDSRVPKARALQLAQQSLIADPVYGHPAYWSAFVLVNNWR